MAVPLGAMLAGGVLGGLLGGMSPDTRAQRMREALSKYDGQVNPLMERLQNQAKGVGPSLAEEQMRRALGRTANQMQGMAAAARPGQNQALARRQAMQQGAALQAEQAGQGALLRLQEQQQANAQLASLIQGLRGQDLNAMAGLNQGPTKFERFLGGIQGGMQAGSMF